MRKIILSIVIVFVFAALIPNLLQKGMPNSLYAYFLYVIDFIVQNYFIFILGFIALIIIFFRFVKFDKNYSLKKNYSLFVLQIINVLITAFFLSYVALLVIAFIELNVFSILININPKTLGIVSDKNAIINTIKKNNYSPEITTSESEQNKELVKVASTITGTGSFYGYYILSSIPGFFVLPIKISDSGMLLIDNTLIFTKLNPVDLQEISPIISYSLVQNYFSERKIKSYPKISIMKNDEYLAYREEDFKNGSIKINKEIEDYKKQITAISQSIEEDGNQILYSKSIVDKSNSEYKKCLSNGDYSLSYCKNLLSNFKLQDKEAELSDWNNKLLSDKDKLKGYSDYYDFYVGLGQSLQFAQRGIPHEFGTFIPKDVIRIAFNVSDPSHTIADYLETLMHEYLHYASYISDDKKLSDVFFEEGLTEYFARQIIKDDLNISTNIGYPVSAKILDQMTKRISESELADIYFSKDQDRLEKLLDRTYGENFYKNTGIKFLNLQYASSPDLALKIANEIMKNIGGNPLKEKDLLSTSN
jgi:hypothetical protein